MSSSHDNHDHDHDHDGHCGHGCGCSDHDHGDHHHHHDDHHHDPENSAELGVEQVNPVLVEVTRNKAVESFHRGAIAVVDVQGGVVFQLGDIDRAIYPRSAIKPFQALPLVETGAADAFGFSDSDIALACSSHSGEAEHVAAVRAILARLDLDETALECGPDWPLDPEVGYQLAAKGGKSAAIYNNCSGKHAGFLALAKHMKVPTKGYVKAHHPVQQRILGTMEQVCATDLSRAPMAIDGCSVPTWAISLGHLAFGFACFATGEGLSATRAQSAKRIYKAISDHPLMIAGTGRSCSKLVEMMAGKGIAKVGAEGVYCAALPDYGLGVALKIDDGAKRAAEVAMAAVLAKIGVLEPDSLQQALLLPQIIANRQLKQVGEIRPVGELQF